MTKTFRSFLLAGVSSVALAGAASAADMGMPAKAPYAPPPVASWQGFYIGGNVGAARDNNTQLSHGSDNDNGSCMGSNSCSISATGAIAGLQGGYNWQFNHWVVGIEGDWDWAGLSNANTTTNATFATLNTKVQWLASVRGRMGLAVDDTMVYFTGGVAWAGTKSGWGGGYTTTPAATNFACGVLCSNTVAGWVAGLGVEHMLTANWVVGAEALYYSFENQTKSITIPAGTYSTQFQHEVIAARLRLSYKW